MMKRGTQTRRLLFKVLCLGSCCLALAGSLSAREESNRLPRPEIACEGLLPGFQKPPDAAKPWVYWWWLNGYVSKDGIVRDLDAMREHGISGALVFHAGAGKTPKATVFLSPEWRAFFRFVNGGPDARRTPAGRFCCTRNIDLSLSCSLDGPRHPTILKGSSGGISRGSFDRNSLCNRSARRSTLALVPFFLACLQSNATDLTTGCNDATSTTGLPDPVVGVTSRPMPGR